MSKVVVGDGPRPGLPREPDIAALQVSSSLEPMLGRSVDLVALADIAWSVLGVPIIVGEYRGIRIESLELAEFFVCPSNFAVMGLC